MNIYKTKWLQIIIMLLFPITIFGVLVINNDAAFWIGIVVLLLFCALWKNIIYLLCSNLLMLLITIPLWWFLIASRYPTSQEALAWAPVTFVYYLVFTLFPIIMIVLIRNSVIRYFANKTSRCTKVQL